jgi:hypothetical protein
MTGYSCNSTYDSTNLQRCTDDLYTEDELERSYETYMDYWCDLLYDTSKPNIHGAKARLRNKTPFRSYVIHMYYFVCLLNQAMTAAVHF